MSALQLGTANSATFWCYFPQQFFQEQFAAHSDTAMNLPCRNHDFRIRERLVPGAHVLVNAVDQRSIQIKKHGWRSPGLCGYTSCGLVRHLDSLLMPPSPPTDQSRFW